MNKEEYLKIVKKYTPKENSQKDYLLSFTTASGCKSLWANAPNAAKKINSPIENFFMKIHPFNSFINKQLLLCSVTQLFFQRKSTGNYSPDSAYSCGR